MLCVCVFVCLLLRAPFRCRFGEGSVVVRTLPGAPPPWATGQDGRRQVLVGQGHYAGMPNRAAPRRVYMFHHSLLWVMRSCENSR